MYWDVTVVLEFVQVNRDAIYIGKIQQLKGMKYYKHTSPGDAVIF